VGSALSVVVGLAVVELESGLQKHSEQVNQVLRAVKTSKLDLTRLVFLALLCLLVINLLISNGAHLFRVAILDVERILALEEDVTCELLGQLALVLLLEVHESLLRTVDECDTIHFALACSLKVNL